MNPVNKPSVLQIHSASVLQIHSAFQHFHEILNTPEHLRHVARIQHEAGRLRISLSEGPDYLCLSVSKAVRGDASRYMARQIIPNVRWRSLHAAQINWKGHLASQHSEAPLELRELMLITALINLPLKDEQNRAD
jgi:hypothetical protein